MGRMILCPHCNSTLNEDLLKQRNSENVCLVCGKSLSGDDNESAADDEHPDWILGIIMGIKSIMENLVV